MSNTELLVKKLLIQGTPSEKDALIILNLRARIKSKSYKFED